MSISCINYVANAFENAQLAIALNSVIIRVYQILHAHLHVSWSEISAKMSVSHVVRPAERIQGIL